MSHNQMVKQQKGEVIEINTIHSHHIANTSLL